MQPDQQQQEIVRVNIRELMLAQRPIWRQKDLARVSGVAPRTVSNILYGQTIGPEVLEKLADAFKLTSEQLCMPDIAKVSKVRTSVLFSDENGPSHGGTQETGAERNLAEGQRIANHIRDRINQLPAESRIHAWDEVLGAVEKAEADHRARTERAQNSHAKPGGKVRGSRVAGTS